MKLGSRKILGKQKFLIKKTFWFKKKCWIPKNIGSKKFLGQKPIWVRTSQQQYQKRNNNINKIPSYNAVILTKS